MLITSIGDLTLSHFNPYFGSFNFKLKSLTLLSNLNVDLLVIVGRTDPLYYYIFLLIYFDEFIAAYAVLLDECADLC
jgi:hypothetical protein